MPPPDHCRREHPQTPANTRVNANGTRACKVCQREAKARKKARRAATVTMVVDAYREGKRR